MTTPDPIVPDEVVVQTEVTALTPEGEVAARRLTAWLRTVLPGAWSALIAWALTSAAVPDSWLVLANGLGTAVVFPIVLAAVYPAMRWLEPRMPRWLVLALLGSTSQPFYAADRHAA